MEKTKNRWIAGKDPSSADQATNSNELENEALLVEASRRDMEAFAALYRRYAIPVYRYLYQRVGNTADAEDLTSQVFTDALEGLFHYRDQGNFAAWLFTIARRKAIAHYRRKRPDLSFDETRDLYDQQAGLLQMAVDQEKLERITSLVKRLDPDDQELIRLRFAADLTYREIGSILKKSEAAIKMAVHRLVHQLQKEWEKPA